MHTSETFTRFLDLIQILSDNSWHTVNELCQDLRVTSRTIYYDLEVLKSYGFTVLKQRNKYQIDPQSKFFQNISANLNLTDAEAHYIYNLVDGATSMNPHADSVQMKLRKHYPEFMPNVQEMQKKLERNLRRLRLAIEQKCVVVLKNYSSPHSNTIRDRMVEPFMLINDGLDVRCFEISSRMNKNFRLLRIGKVEMYDDVSWSFEKEHREVYTDIFMFNGEQKHRVKLKLGQLAYNVLCEEYPQASLHIKPLQQEPNHWLLDIEVASYVGIGRFILGLFSDITIIEGEGLRQYLRNQVALMQF